MMSAAVMIGIAGDVETAQKMSSGAEQSLMPSFAQSLGESVDLSDGKPPQSEEGNEKRMAGSFSASGVAFSIGSSKVVVHEEESGKQLEGQKILSSGEAKVVPSREIERDGKPDDFLKEKPGIVSGGFGKAQGVSANGIESEKDDLPVKMETEKVAGEEVSGEEHVLADPSGEEMEATSSSESGPPVIQKTAWSNPTLKAGAPRHEEVPAISLYDGRPSVLKLGKPVEAKSEESASLKEVGSKEKKAGAKTVSSSGKSGKREGALKTASSASEAQGVVSILPQMLAPVSAIVAAPEKDDSGVGVAHESGISIGTVVAEDVRGRQDAALVSPPVGKGEADIAGGKVPLKGDKTAADFNVPITGVPVASANKEFVDRAVRALEDATPVRVGAGEGVAGASVVLPLAHVAAGGDEIRANVTGGAHRADVRSVMEDSASSAVAEEVVVPHRTMLATPTALEVGLPDGTQGWLKIRAEMANGGGVHASLSPATSAGQEMLHRELPGLTAYLHEEKVAISAVIVHPLVETGSRFAGGMEEQGRGHGAESRADGGGSERRQSSEVAAGEGNYIGYKTTQEMDGDEVQDVGMYTGGGSWLNVRA